MNYYYLALVFCGFHVCLALCIRPQVSTNNGPSNFNVLSYGAVGDGLQDDTQAFLKAWNEVCGVIVGDVPTLTVPAGKTFLLTPTTFPGPCHSPGVHVQIEGKIVAPGSRDGWRNCSDNCWLVFSNINNLVVDGSGVIDGQGSSWWKHDHAKNVNRIGDTTCHGPRALRFKNCNGLQLQGLTHLNSPKAHISILGCNNSTISNIHIKAPGRSPNTDGIDLTDSTQVQIRDSTIATGDDCIAIGSGTSRINVTGITCGPGHGISIGSLGRNGVYAKVEQVLVKNCTFKGSTNGARIKTWQGGAGYARDITFEDISLIDVRNPIIINQYYCNHGHDCRIEASAVEISGVTYRGFQGTAAKRAAIDLNCSSTVACTGILMETVDITSTGPHLQTFAACNNAQGKQDSVTPHVSCLQ